jgi:hypothetical protein
VAVKGNGGRRFKLLAVKGGEDSDDIVGACRGLNDASTDSID